MIAVPAATRDAQLKATDPFASAFVTANAGSGKTYVLTRRVIRLLVAGTDPGRILCLTFTKAAAAEMSTRIFAELGRWATLPDDKLLETLVDLEGGPVERSRLAPARRLFARALETPGGLKVQTIHAFAEALLQRFALEANLDGRFKVLDGRRASELFAAARGELFATAASEPESPLGRAFASLVRAVSEQVIDEVLAAFVKGRGDFRDWLDAYPDLEAALADLPARLGVPPGTNRETLVRDAIAGSEFSGAALSRLIDVLDGASSTMRKAADGLRAALADPDIEAGRLFWRDVFLTAKLQPRERGFTAAVDKAIPGVNDVFAREAARLVRVEKALTGLAIASHTADAARLADRLIGLIEAKKAELGVLDFDDMIERAATLLSRADAAHWVQYKLDEGLDHVLVDEAQDTSPRQWQIVEAITGEFHAGSGARSGRPRTLFAVGDEKQSIYSFQGAAPHLFGEARKSFGKRLAEARQTVHTLRLDLSFRSTRAVTEAVDAVFADPAAHAGLASDAQKPVHGTVRGDAPGLVEFWPPVEKPERRPDPAWEAPVDATDNASPAVRLATRLADEIAGWLEGGARLEASGEPIRPGDILVLVRKRGPFVDVLNRLLKARDVPVAGVDRLDVVGHIIAEDLMAAARVALLPEDDLTLATVARSPLVGLSEEALFALAHDRKGSLWQATVRRAAAGDADAERLRLTVAGWMRRADRGEPFGFFARLVGPDGGRAAYRARFGREADEVIDEFLDLALAYEGEEVAGLSCFVERLKVAGEPIRRELDAGRDEVRVMTVHGSKGLEAPVVILIDGGEAPVNERNLPPVLRLGPEGGAPLVWRQPGVRPDALTDEATRFLGIQAAEYRRLLYVGLTRARDRLIVAGVKGADKDSEARWHGLVSRALLVEAERELDAAGNVVAWRWRRGGPPVEAKAAAARPIAEPEPLPDWLHRPPAEAVEAEESVRPSGAGGEAEETKAMAAAARRGTVIHALIERLPEVATGEREAKARRYLEAHLAEADRPEAAGLAARLVALIEKPDLAALFSDAARAEAAIAGEVVARDGRRLAVAGAVDRLLVTDDAVLIVDYKTARHVPATVPDRYVLQLALYRSVLTHLWPGRPVGAAILWTETARFDRLAEEALDAALAAFLAASPTEA
jgi:ATP-dependent helicase/nuclease subunit A